MALDRAATLLAVVLHLLLGGASCEVVDGLRCWAWRLLIVIDSGVLRKLGPLVWIVLMVFFYLLHSLPFINLEVLEVSDSSHPRGSAIYLESRSNAQACQIGVVGT